MIHYSRDCLFRIIVFLAVGFMLLFCALAVCYGDYTAATPPGQWGPIPPRAEIVRRGPVVTNGGCCPGGTCPSPQQPSWQPQQPQWQAPAPQIVQRPMAPVAPLRGQQAHAAVCRIRVPAMVRHLKTGQMVQGAGFGTGTLVDVGEGHGMVVTAAHVMEDANGNPTCIFPDGREFAGSPVRDKDGNDIAAILIRDPGIPPVAVVAAPVSRGEAIVSGGYGQDGRYLVRSGTVVRVNANAIEVSGTAREGDSGGPILNRQGQMVGVLWGTDTDTGMTMGTTATRTDAFLTRAGRYLLPWNARINDPARDPRNQPPPVQQPPQVIVQPPMQQLPPPVDLSGVQGKLAEHEARIAEVERRADASKAGLLEAAAKFEKEIPGIKAFAEQKAAESAALAKGADEAAGKATKRVDEALDETNPGGFFARIKGRLEERFGGALGEVSWLKWGGIALACVVAFLFLRKEGAKAAAGEPTRAQELAALTPGQLDDRVAAAVARGQAAVHERLAELRGHVSGLASRVSGGQPPAPPAA